MILRKKVAKLILLALVVSFIASVAMAGDDMATITGTVAKTDTGLIIQTNDGDFTVAGADLAALVGKKVEAIGKVSEGDAGKVFNVVSLKEVQE
jgi:hypothetical protein